jgi:hypothetical protein
LFAFETLITLLDAFKEEAIALLKKEIANEITDSIPEPTSADDEVAPDLNQAVRRLNKAVTFLFRILSILSNEWDPKMELLSLTLDDLDKSIADTRATIQKLMDANDKAKAIESAKKGVFHTLGNGAKSVCIHVKPFLKTFLTVALNASAVYSHARLFQRSHC